MSIGPRRFPRLVALCAIASLLFMQVAVSAFACPGEPSMQAAAAQAEAAPACDMESAPSPLCRAHCDPGAQSPDKPASPTIAAAPFFVLAFARMPEAQAAIAPPEVPVSLLARATAPSLAVRQGRQRL